MTLSLPFTKNSKNQKTVSRKASAPLEVVGKQRKGFTLIEVTLVLALAGLLLVGLLGGTAAAIKAQRYNDSVRTFAEYLRTIYSEVINPATLGSGNSSNVLAAGGGNYAIYGKVLTFGYKYDNEDDTRSVYSATLIGDANVPNVDISGFINELAAVQAELFCGKNINGVEYSTTVSRYEPTWQAELMEINTSPLSVNNRFRGTVIIARMPSSGAIHTVYTPEAYDLRDGCKSLSESAASTKFQKDIYDYSQDPTTATVKFYTEPVGFCVKSQNVSAGNYREVRIAEDGRNTSAISILNTDDEGDDIGGQGRCR